MEGAVSCGLTWLKKEKGVEALQGSTHHLVTGRPRKAKAQTLEKKIN